jgi:hypothetical protein
VRLFSSMGEEIKKEVQYFLISSVLFCILSGAAISYFFTHYSSCHYSEPLDATIQADRRNIIMHSHSPVVVYM